MEAAMECREHLDVLLRLAQDMGYEILRSSRETDYDAAGDHFTKVLIVNPSTGHDQQAVSVSHQLGADPQLALYELNEQQELALRIPAGRAA